MSHRRPTFHQQYRAWVRLKHNLRLTLYPHLADPFGDRNIAAFHRLQRIHNPRHKTVGLHERIQRRQAAADAHGDQWHRHRQRINRFWYRQAYS